MSYALAALLGVCITPALNAQDTEQAPAHIAMVDGRATLEREGEIEQAAGGVPFVPGDRLRTEAGRVELVFPDGSSLDVDEFTSIDLLSPTLLRMNTGRVLLRVAGADHPSAALRYQIDTPVASAVTDGPGEFRVALFSGPSGAEAELAVLRGWASLTTERGTTAVRAGERTLARDDAAPLRPQAFNSARLDAFDRWADARRAERAGTAASAQYLPNDLRVYGGAFDRYGAWQYEASYGYVWYPSVAADWRPYYNGYWSPVRPYGWTWIGVDIWSWPTHHYGRWGYSSTRWFWIPERRWASAWVSWGAAPGYVSWCPLGFDNRPVFGLSVHVGNPWAGWTVVPRTHFGRDHVRQWAVDPQRQGGARPLLTSASAPVAPPPTRAVPRNTVGAAAPAAGTAVPRSFGSRQSAVDSRPTAVASQPSGVSHQSAAGGRSPVRNPQSAVGALQMANPSQQWPSGSRQAPARSPQSTAGSQPSASENSRAGGWAVPRQPSAVTNLPVPGGTPTFDRTAPNADRRQPADVWLKQPLPQAAPRAYQRVPGAGETTPRANSPELPQYQQAVPRWNAPGAAVSLPSSPSSRPGAPSRDGETQPDSAAGAAPRWYGYRDGVVGSQPSIRNEPRNERRNEPQPEAGPPPARSGPVYRGPGAASPRSSPPSAGSDGGRPSSSGSGSGGANSGPSGGSRSGSGSSGGGGRQRHP